jgi:hypothetical protein
MGARRRANARLPPEFPKAENGLWDQICRTLKRLDGVSGGIRTCDAIGAAPAVSRGTSAVSIGSTSVAPGSNGLAPKETAA